MGTILLFMFLVPGIVSGDDRQDAEEACGKGDARACFAVALAVLSGPAGMERDYERASLLLDKACRAGEEGACSLMALAALGMGRFGDAAKAAERGCLDGAPGYVPFSCRVWGVLLWRDQARLREASKAFALACDNGISSTCLQAEYLNRLWGASAVLVKVTDDHIKWTKTECEYDGLSCFALSDWYKDKGNIKESEEYKKKGMELLQVECADGDKIACQFKKWWE